MSKWLSLEGIPTFTHRWEEDGKSGTIELPKFLYRGEPSVYSSTTTAQDRLMACDQLVKEDKRRVLEIVSLAMQVWGSRTGETLKAIGWAQHYGLPTYLLDVTHEPSVAMHFAAMPTDRSASSYRRVYRIDYERLIGLVHCVYLGGDYCIRARRQAAWGLLALDPTGRGGREFDLQQDKTIEHGVEMYTVSASDADEFLIPGLLDDRSDGYATWPAALLRGYKYRSGKPFSPDLADWLCDRIPLYDWIPCDVHFGLQGISESYSLRSPAAAEEEDGMSFCISKDALTSELVSERYHTPNPVLFAILRDEPLTTRRLGLGARFDVVMWMGGFDVPFGP